MKNCVLCYLEKDGKYLMLNRNKKRNDINGGKWIGVGGKFESGESPEECLLREVYEETGYKIKSYRFRGIVTFDSDIYDTEYMFLYTSCDFDGNEIVCDEGDLHWIDKSDVLSLPLWEGDKVFLRYLFEDRDVFSLKLSYHGDELVSVKEEF